ncbi:MAG: PP2C family protein-serine/threonine phosphatase [Acidimicrobiales bacterium]
MITLFATVCLTVVSERNYASNERRLTTLQTQLTGSVLQTASPQLVAFMGRVVGLAAEAPDPVSSFRSSLAGQLAPEGQYSSASLVVVTGLQVRVLAHVGAPTIENLTSESATALFLQAAHASTLITTRAVAQNLQRLGYLLSAQGSSGVYVLALSQDLPPGGKVSVPARSPDANLNFALYFGPTVRRTALIATDAPRLPLSGTLSKTTVPFGDNVLTLVASPRHSLAGGEAQDFPLVVLVAGLMLTACAVLFTERLVRRRDRAESAASLIDERYREQRNLVETLQRSFLPKALPDIPGFDLAARYLPATKGVEVGGDWYSVIRVDDHRFALVIGDVSGHGASAATVMASVRYTVRTLASVGHSPDEILEETGRLLDSDLDGHFVTVLVGVFDDRTNELTLASAGHLPPLVVRDGRAEFVPVAPGTPLGVPGTHSIPMTVEFRPGSTLIAFTDGLVERRRASIETGLETLSAAATEYAGSPNDLIEHLYSALDVSDHEDDIAVLVVGHPERSPLPASANAEAGEPSWHAAGPSVAVAVSTSVAD